MKKNLLMMLAVVLLLVGCGNTDTTDNTQGTETKPTEKQEEPHTHAYTESITTEATCEADGLKTFTCECGDTYTEVISSKGHSYEDYIYNNDATTSVDGTETATCSVCGGTHTRTKVGTKITKKWYDGYTFNTWHDMGEYFFYIAKSYDEANAAYNEAFNAGGPSDIIKARYPGFSCIVFASPVGDGTHVAVVYKATGNPGEPGFSRPHFIWE